MGAKDTGIKASGRSVGKEVAAKKYEQELKKNQAGKNEEQITKEERDQGRASV